MNNWLNRHTTPLPLEECLILIKVIDIHGTYEIACKWKPYIREMDKRFPKDQPSKGYIGTARTIDLDYNIGYNVWKQNDSEFTEYKLLNDDRTVIDTQLK